MAFEPFRKQWPPAKTVARRPLSHQAVSLDNTTFDEVTGCLLWNAQVLLDWGFSDE